MTLITSHRILFAAGASILLFSGCSDQTGVRIEDNWGRWLLPVGTHGAYVAGTSVEIRVQRHKDEHTTYWSSEVSDPNIFFVRSTYSDREGYHLKCKAVTPGETTLTIRDADNELVTARTMRVERPDRFELRPAGLVLVRGEDAPTVGFQEPVKILYGGTATFEVQYYRGSERLFGYGLLRANVSRPGLTTRRAMGYPFENREWLQLTADSTGLWEVELTVRDQPVGTFAVQGLSEQAIDRVEIEPQDTLYALQGDTRYLLGRAFVGTGADIWGVEFSWHSGGSQDPLKGDLYRYKYYPGVDRIVRATTAGRGDEERVQGVDGKVVSSNYPSYCNMMGPVTGLTAMGLPLMFWLLLAAWRNRVSKNAVSRDNE